MPGKVRRALEFLFGLPVKIILATGHFFEGVNDDKMASEK